MRRLGSAGCCIGLLSGCTSWLWDHTEMNSKVWISGDDITEAELKKKGVEYEVYDVEGYEGFLINQSFFKKFHNFHLRLFGTPVTVVVDGVGYLTVGLAVCIYSSPEMVAAILEAALNSN